MIPEGLRARHPRAAPPVRAAQRDLLTGGITIGAILIFAASGSRALTSLIDMVGGRGGGIDALLTSAVLLNIALILFGWRRYRDLSVEVVERAAAEDRARLLASHDPLTGLLNRRSLAEGIAAMFGRAAQRDKTLALLMVDLDHFKTINDSHDHETGDALLRAAGAAIVGIVPPGALVARLGGDEFGCAFLYDAIRPSTVDLVAERLVEAACGAVRPRWRDGAYLRLGRYRAIGS